MFSKMISRSIASKVRTETRSIYPKVYKESKIPIYIYSKIEEEGLMD